MASAIRGTAAAAASTPMAGCDGINTTATTIDADHDSASTRPA
jgi:hypothetical protein